jgi:nucleolar protein 56
MPIGIFAVSEKELIYYELFEKKAENAVKSFCQDVPDNFVKHLNGYQISQNHESEKFIRERIRQYAISLGFVSNDIEFNKFITKFAFLLSKESLKGSIGRDKLIIQASNALEDLNTIINVLTERLYEWYSLHYPEIKYKKGFDKDILNFGSREKFPDFEKSVGVDINEEDENAFISYSKIIKNLTEEKNKLEKYVKSSVKSIAPNFSSLIDPLLATKFLCLAGSLEKLARMPASTIQLLGAEKALFRHLHKKGKSPKYGIIYNSSYVQSAPDALKGKISRIVASKLMLACRVDFYSGRYEPKLKKDLEDEINSVLMHKVK